MKVSPIAYVIITSILLLTVALFASMDFPFNVVFYMTMAGEVLFLFTVFQVLKDDYKTEKTFENFYEDHPIEKEFGATRELQGKEQQYDN